MMDHFVFIPFCIALILSLKHLCVSIQYIDLKATYYNGDRMPKAVRKKKHKVNLFTNIAVFCSAPLWLEKCWK